MRRVRVAATGAVRRRATAFERQGRARTCRISAVVTPSRARQALPPMIRGSLALSELSSGLSAQSTSTTLAGQTCRVDRFRPGRSRSMGMLKRALLTLAAGVAGGASLVMSAAQQPARPAAGIAVDADDIGGTVTSARGPEAGVWVIAETTDYAHEAPQDRRDRRPGSLPPARPADQGQLQPLGPRIRPGGLGARAGHAGEKPGVDGARGA